jgi:hypothetical protein
MRQTTLSVVLEINPASVGILSNRIEQLKKLEETPPPGQTKLYANLTKGVPSLHFMSMSVFEGADYDPLFVIEANFDGPPGPFWAQLEALHGACLREMLRCCKRPGDESGPLYDAVTAPHSRYPIAPYLEARTVYPSVFHNGNRGLARDRITQESELFMETRAMLAKAALSAPDPYRGKDAVHIHKLLRAAVVGKFGWLNQRPPARIPPGERVLDFLYLALFIYAVVFALSIPGIALSQIATTGRFLLALAILLLIAGFLLYRMRDPLPGKAAYTRRGGLTPASLSSKKSISPGSVIGFVFWIGVFVASYHLLATLLAALAAVVLTENTYGTVLGPTFRAVGLGFLGAILCGFAVVVWLRGLERRDSSHDAPAVNERMMREMTRREDRIAQNHMGSVVLVKPGVLRMALFRTGHFGLNRLLRVVATDGYLGSMRTVHFAHWAFVNNGSRLLFFSNFDHSWDSYLDDFIEKAHGGLTLAWGSGTGFPATRFLVLDGASHGRQFKTWARHSMAVSRFWFSAYKNLTVDQIERQARIADGLRKKTLTPKEAGIWARDL